MNMFAFIHEKYCIIVLVVFQCFLLAVVGHHLLVCTDGIGLRFWWNQALDSIAQQGDEEEEEGGVPPPEVVTGIAEANGSDSDADDADYDADGNILYK